MWETEPWCIGQLTLHRRVLFGSANYPSREILLAALSAAEAELVTVALRRVQLQPSIGTSLYALLQARGYKLLPNTAGCFTAEDAVRTAEMAREALQTNLVKLEVIADEQTQLPEPEQLLRAAGRLVRAGFCVLPYTNDDPVTAQKLADAGCAAVMPLAAPIGSGLGIRNAHNLELIRTRVNVPLIVDAGLGTASDVALAMELGCDAVLLNSAVARACDPVQMARAVSAAALSGFLARHAGRIPRQFAGKGSTPLEGRAWR